MITDRQPSFLLAHNHAWQSNHGQPSAQPWICVSVLSYPKTQTCCAEKYCLWKPRGVPAPLPPQVLVETTLANLACLARRLVMKNDKLLTPERRMALNHGRKFALEPSLPLQVAQYKEVMGGATAQPKSHHSVLLTVTTDSLFCFVVTSQGAVPAVHATGLLHIYQDLRQCRN